MRLVRALILAAGISVGALIAVPMGSALAVEHFNISPASALANLGSTAAGACGYRYFTSGWVGQTDSATGTYVQESVTDWYYGCRAGNVGMSAQWWGRCRYIRQGSFWDSSSVTNVE